ncbi:hypothetical protein [Nonomuraea sp. NPDC002799]
MDRHLRTAALLVVAVLLASCGTAPAAPGASGAPGVSGSHSAHAGVPAPAASPLRSGERFASLTMAEPYAPAPPNGGTDDYRCFLIDPQLASRAFLTGALFQPQNTELVHHAIFFRLGPDQAAEARRLDDATPG